MSQRANIRVPNCYFLIRTNLEYCSHIVSFGCHSGLDGRWMDIYIHWAPSYFTSVWLTGMFKNVHKVFQQLENSLF